jgi:hypothetical protein
MVISFCIGEPRLALGSNKSQASRRKVPSLYSTLAAREFDDLFPFFGLICGGVAQNSAVSDIPDPGADGRLNRQASAL